MNKKKYFQILENAARDHLAKDSDLAPQIMTRIQKGKTTTMQKRIKNFIAVPILLVLAITAFTVPGVKAAIQRWMGYIPGPGLVSEEQIRMLEEPLVDTRMGVTLTVKQIWSTAEKTVIQYSLEGWERNATDTGSIENTCKSTGVILRLPDQDLEVTQPQTMIGWDTGIEISAIYPAIPVDTNDISFVMPCMDDAGGQDGANDWILPLHLVAAPPETTVYPVIENPTPAVEPSTEVSLSNNAPLTEGLSFRVDKAVQMEDGYLLYVTIDWGNTGLGIVTVPDPTALHLLDPNENEVFYAIDWKATNPLIPAAVDKGLTTFVIKTEPIQGSGQFTLTLDSVAAYMPADTSFTFDPGIDPQSGQSWEINKDIELNDGYSLRVLKVTYDVMDETYARFGYEMESETGVTHAILVDQAHPMAPVMDESEEGSSTPGTFNCAFYYELPAPQEPFTIQISAFMASFPGHWQTTWMLPAP